MDECATPEGFSHTWVNYDYKDQVIADPAWDWAFESAPICMLLPVPSTLSRKE